MNNLSDYKAKLFQQAQNAATEDYSGADHFTKLAASSDQIAELIASLTDPSTPGIDLVGTIAKLHTIRNFSKLLPAHSVELTNALRGLIKSPHPEVRRQSLSYLSIAKDEIAQDHLLRELKSDLPEAEKSVPTYQAISMLSVHPKGLDKEVLLSIARTPPDDESLMQAVRHLPADAETEAVLTGILQDDTKAISTRALIPDMVGAFNPSGFSQIAKRMLEEQGAETEIAPYLARGMANIQSSASQTEIEETKSVIQSLAGEGSEAFKQAAEMLQMVKNSSDGKIE